MIKLVLRILTGAAFLTLAVVATQPALACSDIPNICAAQAQHQQQMIDIAATAPQSEEGSAPASPPPPPDPMQVRMSVAAGMIEMMQTQVDNAAKMAALRKDPRYQRYVQGGWDFFLDHRDAVPGEYCAALYWKGANLVRISGPGGEYDGGMLTFWSPDIPRPEKVELITVTLSQTDYPLQSVKAYNYVLPGEEFGALTLAVPTLNAALATMKDIHTFEVLVEGKSVAKIDWTDGFMARDQLQKCVTAKE